MQDLPFDMQAGQPPFVVVQAEAADDRPLAVLVDTGNGAPYDVLLSPAAAARMKTVPAEGSDKSAAAIGAGPVTFAAQSVPRFRLGPVELRNASAGVSPAVDGVAKQVGRPIDAIIGHRFLAGRTIAIDYAAHRIDFAARVPGGEAIGFTLAPARPLTLVSVTINGHGPFLMALDTGASATLVSPAVARAAGLGGGQQVSLAGAGGLDSRGATLVQGRIALGPYARDGRNIGIADVIAPIQKAAGAPIDGVLGADFLAGMRITIDYGSNRLWIQPSS
ncbi:aspartyl protease family protein [Sphingomonas sp. LB-2]|uniref:aspartyl protease family protein n=1 Tax=Sphingomonas caeni TaxID=2984949 RepID=UPI0022315D0F|nr:aspartyl protease family protein [Sphingomonas caeni]MCW3847144.1 aspartyl protease family protein [Sphingomonas caeni]